MILTFISLCQIIFLAWIIPDAAKPQPNFASKIFAKMTKFLGVIA